MSVTIQEVAEAAGVSKATVSKVLHKSYSISQETCDRVGEFDGAGWTQKGSQYAEARYGLRDTGKLLPYYEKAAGMGDEHAQAICLKSWPE